MNSPSLRTGFLMDHLPRDEQDPNEVTDRSLIRRLRTGSQDAATQLYLRYANRLRMLSRAKCSPDLAARVDSDDIVQSVFRTFFRRAEKGDYDVPDGEDLWKLFLVIGLNKIHSKGTYHRAAKRDVRVSRGSIELEFTADDSDATSLSILQMSIDEVLCELPPEHRDIINLRIEGHEVAAIAERIGRSKRSVERILQEFRKQLAVQIDPDE
jgi:RNA polymerase sigma-70 factor (ECF subfamily)